ncbi:unnamed protein product [Allacma fusca]|uniref:Uncharacterized protein n=1 Tax=Allacma fusca TaxID=39272 RepID=A0A8J2J754_9HEXA|nr:unnamed protein product [Allacma fusca]
MLDVDLGDLSTLALWVRHVYPDYTPAVVKELTISIYDREGYYLSTAGFSWSQSWQQMLLVINNIDTDEDADTDNKLIED